MAARMAGGCSHLEPYLFAVAGLLFTTTTLQAQKTVKVEGRVGDGQSRQNVALAGDLGAFRLDGARLGSIHNIDVIREHGTRHARLRFRIRLDDPNALSLVNRCVITSRNHDAGVDRVGFHCGIDSDIGQHDLVVLGDLIFEPSGMVRALYVPSSELDDDEWSPDGFGGSEAASFNLSADSNSAHMVVRDKNGHSVLQLNADSMSAFFRVRDSAGREVLRFYVDSTRVSGRIRSH